MQDDRRPGRTKREKIRYMEKTERLDIRMPTAPTCSPLLWNSFYMTQNYKIASSFCENFGGLAYIISTMPN